MTHPNFTSVYNKFEKQLLEKMNAAASDLSQFADKMTSGSTNSVLPIRRKTGELNDSLQFRHPSKYVWTIDWTAEHAKYALYRKGKTPRNLLGDNGRLRTEWDRIKMSL